MITTNNHIIFTDAELRCTINALDVLKVLVCGDALDSDVLRDLRDTFPPTAIEAARKKLY